MKKWKTTMYFCVLLLSITTSILFVINICIEKNKKQEEKKRQKIEKEEKNIIEYKANETLRVRLTKTGEIVAMDINDYLRGVVPAEMPPYYDIEAIKAQAVVARTYTYKKIEDHAEGDDADICDNFAHCQAYYNKEQIIEIWRKKGYDEETILKYWDNVNEAVTSTQDEVIVYNNNLIKAFFHASSPVKTESVDQIWGGESIPYLVSVENEESEEYENRTSKVTISYEEFLNKLKDKYKDIEKLSLEECKNIKILEYTTSGRVKTLQLGNYQIKSEDLRSIFGLRSTNFTFELGENDISFNVMGNGHGVGLSQVGADYYAKKRKNV